MKRGYYVCPINLVMKIKVNQLLKRLLATVKARAVQGEEEHSLLPS